MYFFVGLQKFSLSVLQRTGRKNFFARLELHSNLEALEANLSC